MPQKDYDIIIIGGGVGGCAAALAATDLGCRVLMTEETAWIGGQLTSQAVPPDEHAWIESYGRTASYRRFRDLVRRYYRDNYPLNSAAANDPQLNPGQGWVSGLCHEPRVALAVLEQMLAPARSAGRLEIRAFCKAVGAECDGDRITSVTVEDIPTGLPQTYSAPYILDATELGDLLPLAGVEYTAGAESRAEFGELHAPEGPAQRDNVQAFTWCFPMAYDPAPGAEHVIEKPRDYDFWRGYVPELHPVPWPGPLIGFRRTDPFSMQPVESPLFNTEGKPGLFNYRRIVSSALYQPGAIHQDVSLVNWPQNDYLPINIIDKPKEVVEEAYRSAKQLSLSLLYWLQTEAPRPDGGQGYPGLAPRPDIVGATDGLAMAPYIREARRIKARFTVTEAHIGAEMLALDGQHAPPRFDDSVGAGYYRIDLHPSTGGDNYIDIESRVFQIPLGALLPTRVQNLLPACKNLGVTHITNGCYRLHPVEWNIGESAGYLAAWCTLKNLTPHQVHERKDLLTEFQQMIRTQGVQIEWPKSHFPAP